jgi:hypothetical protein
MGDPPASNLIYAVVDYIYVLVTIVDVAIWKFVGGDRRPYRNRGPLRTGPSATTGDLRSMVCGLSCLWQVI